MVPAHESTCKPMAEWMRICRQDFATIIGIAFFILYVLLGVGPSIKAVNWCRARLSRKGSDSKTTTNNSEEYYGGQDPYHSPTLLLKRYLTRSAHTTIPPTTYFPTLSRGSPEFLPPPLVPSSRSTVLQEQLQERLRLAEFRFPSSRRTPAPPQAIPDLFCSSARSSRYSQETDTETLSEVDLNSGDTEKGCSNDYDEKASLFHDDRPTRPESMARLPSIPPPAYLDLDQEMEPERFEYPAV